MKIANDDKKFYLVREDVMPEAMIKTLEVKEMLDRGKADSIADAVKRADLREVPFINTRILSFPFQPLRRKRLSHFSFIWMIAQALFQNCSVSLLLLDAMSLPYTKRFHCKVERM